MSRPLITFDEIQELLHLYFSYFSVNEYMGRVGANKHATVKFALDESMARASVIQYWLDTVDTLRQKGVPEEKIKDPSDIADINDLYKYWLEYKKFLWDPKIHLLTWDKFHDAITIFSAGLQTSHTQKQEEPFPEFLPSSLREEEQH